VEAHAAIEKLRMFIIDHDLPRTDLALFGVRCPYCGKSDRIRELDAPESLQRNLTRDSAEIYSELWKRLNPLSDILGVCKFCQNPLRLSSDHSCAEVLDAHCPAPDTV
jgi:hypothetical protein